jgi:hypothetical protein
MENERPLSSLLVAAALLSLLGLTGCSQLKTLFETRPSEKMPQYHPVEVEYSDQHWSADQRHGFTTPRKELSLCPTNGFSPWSSLA